VDLPHVRLEAEFSFLTTAFLVFIRVSALFLLTPLFAAAQVPVNVRVVLLLALSVLLLLGLGLEPVATPSSGEFLVAALQELFIGALMAFGLFAAFAAFLFGGRVLDFQMGFGVANLIDPSTNTQAPLIGTVLNLAAVTTFFLLNGHHWVIRGLAWSFYQLPPGQPLQDLNAEAVVAQFGLMFVYGLMLVAPAVFALLLLDVGLAVAARTMPQVNIFIVGLPLKILVGLSVLAASLNYLGPLLQRVFSSIFRYWEQLLPGTV
jgi:flagellar biosynthesis protein FliR